MARRPICNPRIPNISFKVTRMEAELIPPAKPTPRELKLLSDIDSQAGFRFELPIILVYKSKKPISETNQIVEHPAKVIRAALSEALVYYYPFAGRMREVGGKLAVDCTGEGLMFVEAEADVRLEALGEEICPPFSCLEDLLFEVPGSYGVLHCPLFLIQATRFRCGGFTFAIRLNHAMSDAGGLSLFVHAVAQIARGSPCPSVLPVWRRELLTSRGSPESQQVTCLHPEYEEVADADHDHTSSTTAICRCFFFGPREISILRRLVIPHNPRGYSTFEILTACLWRCRTIALQLDPNEEVRLSLVIDVRSKCNPPLPSGYYGNAIAYSAAISTAKEISKNPPSYALELVKRAKDAITEEHLMSLLNLMVIRGWPQFTKARSYLVSDSTRAGLADVDFGWGKPGYAGPANPRVSSFFVSYENREGTRGILVSVVLPPLSMERFASELERMLDLDQGTEGGGLVPEAKVFSSL